jgi:hypothetical protein
MLAELTPGAPLCRGYSDDRKFDGGDRRAAKWARWTTSAWREEIVETCAERLTEAGGFGPIECDSITETTIMKKVTVLGAGGKMGYRVSANLRCALR